MSGIGDSLEGIHAVAAALAAGRVISLTVETGRADSPEMRELVAAATTSGVAIARVDDVRPLAVTSAPQGVVASAEPLATVSIDELVAGVERPALVMLDHAEDPRNVGAIARSARAAGFDGLVVAARRAAPLGATTFKAAAGALESLSVAVVSSIADAVSRLQERSVWTVALDAAGAESLYDVRILDEPVAIVIGAEVIWCQSGDNAGIGVRFAEVVVPLSRLVPRPPLAHAGAQVQVGVEQCVVCKLPERIDVRSLPQQFGACGDGIGEHVERSAKL